MARDNVYIDTHVLRNSIPHNLVSIIYYLNCFPLHLCLYICSPLHTYRLFLCVCAYFLMFSYIFHLLRPCVLKITLIYSIWNSCLSLLYIYICVYITIRFFFRDILVVIHFIVLYPM